MKKKRVDDEVEKAAAILAKDVKRRKKLALKILKIALVGYKNRQQRWKSNKIWLTDEFYGKFTSYCPP